MDGHINSNTVPQFPTKQILPVRRGRASLVIDNDYMAHLQFGDDRINICFGNGKDRFNCVKFSNCAVLSKRVRSMAIFAQTVIIEDSSLDCEELYVNLKNELEVRSGKIQFSTMKVEAKHVNIERSCLIDGNQLIIISSESTSLSGGFNLATQLFCRAPQVSIGEHSSIATSDLLLLPAKSLKVRGALRSKKLFVGNFNENLQKVLTSTARVEISGEVDGDKVSIVSSNDVVFSGRVSVNEMDCSGKEVKVEKCQFSARKLQVHAQTTKIDAESVLEGNYLSFLIEDEIVLAYLSSFQFDGLLAIECRSLVCEGGGDPSSHTLFRSGDICISSAESIDLGGALKCKKLILKCKKRSVDVIFQENTKFDLDSLLVFGNGSRSCVEKGKVGEVVFDSGSVILCSMFVAIEVEKEVVLKGSLKRDLCYSPNLSIKTTKSIKFVNNCHVSVGDTQLLFGNELILDDRANVYVSGRLFLLQHPIQIHPSGVLRISKDCVLVARRDIICQFGECYVEGALASEEESILLGRNDNQSPCRTPEGSEKKEVKLDQLLKNVVQSLKPSSKPLSSLFKKIQDKRIELIQSIEKIIHLREEDTEQKSFVMEFIFISGEIRAMKSVIFVSRDISIQNGSSIKCTSVWDTTAILMYSNRSVFQCSSELDASTVLIVSPIVFQLLSLIKAHNLSISAAAVFRLACVCNATKTILKSPLILSGLNVVAPNVRKTLHKMRSDLVENCVDVVMLIERLADARAEHREFDVFLVESMKLFKKHSHLALLHSLELVHFAFQIVNLLVPKSSLIITLNVMSIIRATMFLLFSVKNIRKSIKRYLTSERQNFILVEIVGDGLFSLYQVVGVVTSFTSLYNQIKSVLSSRMNSSSVDIPTLKGLPRVILDRTKDLVSRGPLSALSSVLGVFDTFVLNDYTKYAVGLFSYLPSSMSFSVLNLSGELQLGMYVVNSSTTCSLNGSVVVLSYNCSSTNLVSFSPRSNVVICNGGIYETSTFGKVDRGVKISQRSLVLTGGRRVHDGGFHFGESVVLKMKNFEQLNNRLMYNQIGGFSLKEWNLNQSEFRPVSSSEPLSSSALRTTSDDARIFDGDNFVEGVDKNVVRSGNLIESVSVGDGSVFYLKGVALEMNNVFGAITLKNVQLKVSDHMKELSTIQIAGGSNSIVSDCDVNVHFSIQLTEGGHLNIISSSTTVNCTTDGEGHIAFHNAEIGEHANIQHTGSTFIEIKDEQRLCEAITGSGKYSKIANDGQVNFKVNGEFVLSASDENLFLSETSSVREKQDLGIIAGSIEICRDVVRKKGIQLFSVSEDVVIRKSITSKDGSVVINAKHGNVIFEDEVQKGIIVHLESKQSRVMMSRMETKVDAPPVTFLPHKLTVVDGVGIVKSVKKVEVRAKDSVVIMANEGRIIMDPCVIYGGESVVLEGMMGVTMKDICVTTITHKNSRNPFYSKRKKVINGVAETTSITSNGDISIIAAEGSIFASGVELKSSEGRILQRGRDGVINESSMTEVFIKEKKRVLGGLSQEQRKERHDVETPCVCESTEGIYVESEKGSIVNLGVLATGNGVCSFKAGENVLFERRILKHEVSVKKQGFDLSLSILGVDVFESSSTFFENLKREFLESHLPPIGNSPIEVARSVREGNVPEIAANLANALLIPGNLRFIIDAPVKFGLKFNDYDLQNHNYDSLGEGMIETGFLYVTAEDTVEFSNAFGFNAGRVDIEAHKLIEHGAFLNYEHERFSSGMGFSFEPFGGDIFHCVPSMSIDLSIAKESCSIAVCQVGNTALMNVNVEKWDKYGSQTFGETVQGRVGALSFDSTSTVTEGKMHGISLGTTSLGLSDGHSRSSLIVDQTGLYAVNVDDFQAKVVFLKSSRCPVRGTDSTTAEESMEFEKISGTSLVVDFSGFLSVSAMAIAAKGGGKQQISKVKGVGIEKKDYLAVVENSFENVIESEFHFRANDSSSHNDVEREPLNNVEFAHQNHETLTRNDSSLFANSSEADETINERSTLLNPVKNVLKDKGFELKFHYDLNYRLIQDGIEQMHKEVVDEGLLPCLEGAAFEDVDPQLLYPILDIFYDQSTSELDKYTQMLFYRDGEKLKYCDLTESEKQEVFIYQSYLQDGGDFRDFISLCNFYEDQKQSLNDEYAKKSMKDYVRETYPELYLSTGLHDVQNVEEVHRVFMDIKLTYEPDDPMVRQMTFEMDQYYAEQIYNASWAELSSIQQKEIVKIREHALIYQQTDQEVDFAEYLIAKEAQFVDYFANHHQEPDTNVLTSFGILPIELLKESDPILSECMPYQAPQFDNEREYPAPGSGLLFLPAPPEKGGWEGICEYGSTIKNCIRDHFLHILAGRPKVDYEPSQIELFRDKSLRFFFSGVLDLIPFVNGAKWSYQGISGFDPITKDCLDWKERVIDLTFAMFYFQPVANVIIGYGKGAVWEPLKGAWMAGKIIVKDRTLKGVFETMKITGSAAIESISVPTQHLGAFLEMKMFWGVNNVAASFRSSSAWFSNKMEGWKSRFWSKWKWSRRHFDVIMTTRYPYRGRSLAFAGSPATVSGNNLSIRSHHRPNKMSFAANGDNSGFSSKPIRRQFLTKVEQSVLVEFLAKKLYAKALALNLRSAKIRVLPLLKVSDYAEVVELFNASPKLRPQTSRSVEQVKFFRKINRKEILQKVQEISASNPQDGLSGLRHVRLTSRLRDEYIDLLLDLIAKEMYSKILASGMKKTEIFQLPTLTDVECGMIAKRFNVELRVRKKPVSAYRNAQQVGWVRRSNARRIVRKVQEMSSSNPQDGLDGLKQIGIIHLLPDEFADLLVDVFSRKMYSKLGKNAEIRQFPLITSSDYKDIAKRFNSHPRVVENPQFARNGVQVKSFRDKIGSKVFQQKMKQLSLANPQDGLKVVLPLQGILLPTGHKKILVDLFATHYMNKIPKDWDIQRLDVIDLPVIKQSDYKEIAKRYNGHVRVRVEYERSQTQVQTFRRFEGQSIMKEIKARALAMGRKGNKTSFRVSYPVTPLPFEFQKILLEEICKEIFKLMPVNNTMGAMGVRMPKFIGENYVAITKRYNDHPLVRKNPIFGRNFHQVIAFRSTHRAKVNKAVAKRVEKYGIKVESPTVSVSLDIEHKSILVSALAEVAGGKIPKKQNLKKLKVQDIPVMTLKDLEVAAEIYNSDVRVKKEFERTPKQLFQRRYHDRFYILKTLRGEEVNYSSFRKLPEEFRDIILDIVAEMKYEIILDDRITNIPERYKDLPKLRLNSYEVITKRYNADPLVKDSIFERPVEFIHNHVFHPSMSWKQEILRRVQELCGM